MRLRHPVNVDHHQRATLGERLSDRMAQVIGSWRFLIIQSVILSAWVAANAILALHDWLTHAWDPYPFILLNLCLSFQAAYSAPIIMMSQNRQSDKDRRTLEHTAAEADKADEQNLAILEEIKANTALTLAIHQQVGAQASE